MRIIFSFLTCLVAFSVTGQVINNVGICHVNSDPNGFSQYNIIDQSINCTYMQDTINAKTYKYVVTKPVGERWVWTDTIPHNDYISDLSYNPNNGELTSTGVGLAYNNALDLSCVTTVSNEAEFITACSDGSKTIVVIAPFGLANDVTVGNEVELRFECDGLITIQNGVVLTLNGTLVAPIKQVFARVNNNGTGTINGTPKNSTWYPEWFGAQKNNSSFNSSYACDWLTSILKLIGGGTIEFGTGNYYMYGNVVVWSNTTIKGNGTVFHQPSTSSQLDYYLTSPTAGYTRAAVFTIGNFVESVDNVVFENFHIEGHGDALGFNVGNGHTFAAIAGELAYSAVDKQLSNIRINNVSGNNLDLGVYVGFRSNGNNPPESNGDVSAASNIEVYNCNFDYIGLNAISIKEAVGVKIKNNSVINCQSGIEVMDFCRAVNISDNMVYFTGEGIEIGNDTRNALIEGNQIYEGGSTYTNVFDSGDDIPIGIMLKNNYVTSSTWGGGPERPPVTEEVVFSNNLVEMVDNTGNAMETRSKTGAPVNTWSNIHFIGNVFRNADFRIFPPSGNNAASVIQGWRLKSNEFFGIQYDLSSVSADDRMLDFIWEGGTIENPVDFDLNDGSLREGWQIKGVTFKNGLTLGNNSNGFKVIGNIGNIIDNGNNTVSFNIN